MREIEALHLACAFDMKVPELRLAEVQQLFTSIHAMLTGDPSQAVDLDAADDELGKLAALAGVREYPMRVKCATLAWNTLQQALDEATAETV